MIKKILFYFLLFTLLIVILGVLTVDFIDRTAINEKKYYQDMMTSLDTMSLQSFQPGSDVKIGWSKVNITPEKPVPMAGYSPKETFTDVSDSIFIRTMLIDNGHTKVAFISADLLLFPPAVKSRIDELKQLKNLDCFFYFGASHTHSSIGGWDETIAGQITMGDYDTSLVDELAYKVIQSIETADKTKQKGAVKYIKTDASEYVKNRLNIKEKTDGYIRGLEINYNDNSRAYLLSFSAHPTNLPMKSTSLSNDYPGSWIKNLEANENVSFAMFFAGMVGSQNLTAIEANNQELVEKAGEILSTLVLNDTTSRDLGTQITIRHQHLPLKFPDPQLRIASDLRVREWVYESVFDELSGDISIVQLDNILFLAFPADFSGEIYTQQLQHMVKSHKIELVITGFNGDYVGYVVDNQHYDQSEKEEVMVMNWLGPYSDKYFVDIIKKILTKIK